MVCRKACTGGGETANLGSNEQELDTEAMRSDEVTHAAEVPTSRKGGSTKIVDVAAIDTRILILPREISGRLERPREVSRGHSSYRERAVNTTEVSLDNEGLNIESHPNSDRNAENSV